MEIALLLPDAPKTVDMKCNGFICTPAGDLQLMEVSDDQCDTRQEDPLTDNFIDVMYNPNPVPFNWTTAAPVVGNLVLEHDVRMTGQSSGTFIELIREIFGYKEKTIPGLSGLE